MAIAFKLEHSFARTQGKSRGPIIRAADDIANHFAELADYEREVLVVGALDSQCRMIHCGIVGIGTSEHVVARIGDVFTGAVRYSATGIFLVHNHPSGSLLPSLDDYALTDEVATAGLKLGYPLFDHVLIAGGRHRSLMGRPPKELGRAAIRITKASLSQAADRGAVYAKWSCAGCGTQNSFPANWTAVRAFYRRACVPTNCEQCKKKTWLQHGN